MILRSGRVCRDAFPTQQSCVAVRSPGQVVESVGTRRRSTLHSRMGGYLSSPSASEDSSASAAVRPRSPPPSVPSPRRESGSGSSSSGGRQFGPADRRWFESGHFERQPRGERSCSCGPFTVRVGDMSCGCWRNAGPGCQGTVQGLVIGAVLGLSAIALIYGITVGGALLLGSSKTVNSTSHAESSTQFSVTAELSHITSSGARSGEAIAPGGGTRTGVHVDGSDVLTLALDDFLCRAVDSVLWCYHLFSKRCVRLSNDRGSKPESVRVRVGGVPKMPICRGFIIYTEV